MINIFYIIILLFSFVFNQIPISVKQEISIGYDNNFMRFSRLEMDLSHEELFTDSYLAEKYMGL